MCSHQNNRSGSGVSKMAPLILGIDRKCFNRFSVAFLKKLITLQREIANVLPGCAKKKEKLGYAKETLFGLVTKAIDYCQYRLIRRILPFRAFPLCPTYLITAYV